MEKKLFKKVHYFYSVEVSFCGVNYFMQGVHCSDSMPACAFREIKEQLTGRDKKDVKFLSFNRV